MSIGAYCNSDYSQHPSKKNQDTGLAEAVGSNLNYLSTYGVPISPNNVCPRKMKKSRLKNTATKRDFLLAYAKAKGTQ